MQEQTAGKEHTAPKSKQNGKPKRKKSNLSGSQTNKNFTDKSKGLLYENYFTVVFVDA